MKQRDRKQLWVLALLVCLLTGCAGEMESQYRTEPTEPEKMRQEERGEGDEEEMGEDSGISNIEMIIPQAAVTKIEDGLSIVRFEGEDGFSAFLENGGASSDTGVMEYLTKNIFSSAEDIKMEGTPFGCSTISAVNEKGEFLFGRNFDWYPCNALIVVSYPENGYRSLSTVNTDFIKRGAGTGAAFLTNDSIMITAALYAPLDGMNDQGLCVSVNMIEDSDTIDQDEGKTDITTTTAVRMILNNAADVEEAVRLLKACDLHGSFGYMVHFALSDAKGNHAAVEYVDNEMVVTQTPVVTNFYLADGEKHGIGTGQSHERYDLLMERLESQDTLSEEDVKEALESVSKHHYNDGETTEWSIIYNQTTGEAVYFHRENYERAYRIQL